MNGGNRPTVYIIATRRAVCKLEKGVEPVKIYIAGKITGDKKYRAKFRDAAKNLEALGHVVLNPATLPYGLEQVDYMRICLAMLEAADLAVFLPDYKESAGAMVEWAWCQRTGKDCALYMEIKEGGTR